MRQAGLFGLSDQLRRLSDCGNWLQTMGRVVNLEVFRPALEKALAYRRLFEVDAVEVSDHDRHQAR